MVRARGAIAGWTGSIPVERSIVRPSLACSQANYMELEIAGSNPVFSSNEPKWCSLVSTRDV